MLVKGGVIEAMRSAITEYFRSQYDNIVEVVIDTSFGGGEYAERAKVTWWSIGSVEPKEVDRFVIALQKAKWMANYFNSREFKTSFGNKLTKKEYFDLEGLVLEHIRRTDGYFFVPPLDEWKFGQIDG